MVCLRRLMLGGLLAVSAGGSAGCHELQMHRLRRLNYGPGMSSEAYFSVPDAAVHEPPAAADDAARRSATAVP